MRKALLVFLIMLLLGTAIVAFYYVPRMWRISSYENVPSEEENIPESQESETEQFVKLNVDLSESGEWRSSWTDLPLYVSTVAYTVSNYGTATANSIQVAIHIDGVVFKEFSLASLASYNSFADEFSVSVNYDDSKEVSLTASCEGSTDTDTLTVNAILPRTLDSNVARLYITPNDPIVQQTLDDILKNPLIFDWIEIRDWVANKIQYVSDSKTHGASEYWQLPRETLSLRTGDCEDFSILLCALLRANGWDGNEVYVVLGEKDGDYHAWVKLYVDIIIYQGWQNIDPQFGTFEGLFWSPTGYTVKYKFNDVYFTSVSP